MTGDITATVSFTQKLCDGNERTNGDATGGIWKVILHDFDSSLPSYECPDGLKWHIHEKPRLPEGGHFDFPVKRCFSHLFV